MRSGGARFSARTRSAAPSARPRRRGHRAPRALGRELGLHVDPTGPPDKRCAADRFSRSVVDGVRGTRRGLRSRGRALIVNPYASRVSDACVASVLAELPSGTEVVRTQAPEDAGANRRRARRRRGRDLVLSGDGRQRGAERRQREGAARLPAAAGRASCRARSAWAATGIAARLAARGGYASDRARTGQRPGRFSLTRGSFRRRAGARIDQRGRAADGRRPSAPRICASRRRDDCLPSRRFAASLRIEMPAVPRSSRRERDPYTYVGRAPVHLAPAASFARGLYLVARPRCARRDLPRLVLDAARGARGRARLVVPEPTASGSSCGATGRCRSKSTAGPGRSRAGRVRGRAGRRRGLVPRHAA